MNDERLLGLILAIQAEIEGMKAVQLRVSHPNLTDLPMGEELFTKN